MLLGLDANRMAPLAEQQVALGIMANVHLSFFSDGS